MKKIKHGTSLYTFLESRNVLGGTNEEIKSAKRDYWKLRRAELRRMERQEHQELNVSFSRKNGDHGKIEHAAKRHRMPVTTFVRRAALSYLDRSYICPNPNQIARIEQLLMSCLNEVQKIVQIKEKYHWEREQKFDAIAERITALQTEIRRALVYPPEIQKQ